MLPIQIRALEPKDMSELADGPNNTRCPIGWADHYGINTQAFRASSERFLGKHRSLAEFAHKESPQRLADLFNRTLESFGFKRQGDFLQREVKPKS
jgi:hypothetical protein